MTHIELSLSPLGPSSQPAASSLGFTGPLASWAGSVAGAEEACLVIDTDGLIVAASAPCALLFCLSQPDGLTGRRLLDPAVLTLIDFTARGSEMGEPEREQIPPLLALSSGQLARGLMRIRNRAGIKTLDAIATPLHAGKSVAGSLSFFAEV
jgi:hypothetical protein